MMNAIEESSNEFSANASQYLKGLEQALAQSLFDFLAYLSLCQPTAQLDFYQRIQALNEESITQIIHELLDEPILIESQILFKLPIALLQSRLAIFLSLVQSLTLELSRQTQKNLIILSFPEVKLQEKTRTIAQEHFAKALVLLVLNAPWQKEKPKKLKQDIFPILGDYEIKALIAENYYAKTYIACHSNAQQEQRLCAIKITELESMERFEQESQRLSTIQHPLLLSYFDFGLLSLGEKKKLWVALDYRTWISIEDLLKQTLEDELKKLLIQQLLTALHQLHQQQILHKDLRPSDCLISPKLSLQLTGFGLARSMPIPSHAYATLPTHAITTPAYLSPEQLLGSEMLSIPSDIWSAGMMIFEILTADLPWGRQLNYFKITSNIQKQRVPIEHIKDLGNPKLYECLSRCFAKKTEQRYQSVAQLLEDLQIIFDEVDQRNQLPSSAQPLNQSIQENNHPPLPKGYLDLRYWLLSIGLILSIICLGFFFYESQSSLILGPQIEMLFIEGGQFTMGGDQAIEQPKHIKNIPDFYVSKSEITVAQYQSCVAAKACDFDLQQALSNGELLAISHCNFGKANHQNHPMNCISWQQAKAFTHWVNADLPSEAQWEYLAKSAHPASVYPWGNIISCDHAVIQQAGDGCGIDDSWEVCQKNKDKQDEPCDLFGNVSEWVLDEWQPSYLNALPDQKPWCHDQSCFDTSHATQRQRVIRGGSWKSLPIHATPTYRNGIAESFKDPALGFRIVKNQ